MSTFPNYPAARVASECIRQVALANAQATYAAAGIGNASAYKTLVAAIVTAETAHYDRLAAAAASFGVGNDGAIARGNPTASHAQSWLMSGGSTG